MVNNECDLGIDVRSDVKFSDQCSKAFVRASRVINMVGRNIGYKIPDILQRLYKSVVGPHVEYCTVTWSPYYKKDKELLEKLQHRSARLTGIVRNMDYNERVTALDLWTLGERRIGG